MDLRLFLTTGWVIAGLVCAVSAGVVEAAPAKKNARTAAAVSRPARRRPSYKAPIHSIAARSSTDHRLIITVRAPAT